ncbi:MAG TPA: hypothetical protein DCR44_01165 [Acholeplasmatales bacterium]|nr:MAG: hypothetical protein A2Y16_05670 [Tenericutes bacterium GWF2_57_13]HAQ56010.1 hypothetical protein [Acholeplasmatales bacterium]
MQCSKSNYCASNIATETRHSLGMSQGGSFKKSTIKEKRRRLAGSAVSVENGLSAEDESLADALAEQRVDFGPSLF